MKIISIRWSVLALCCFLTAVFFNQPDVDVANSHSPAETHSDIIWD
jgi:hypothetical protein